MGNTVFTCTQCTGRATLMMPVRVAILFDDNLPAAPYAIVDGAPESSGMILFQPNERAAVKIKGRNSSVHPSFKPPSQTPSKSTGKSLSRDAAAPLVFHAATVVVLSTATLADVEGVLFLHLADRLNAHAVQHGAARTEGTTRTVRCTMDLHYRHDADALELEGTDECIRVLIGTSFT